jgi:hypothetical protein
LIAALSAFGLRSYWRRVWIIQEIISAKDLMLFCGRAHLPWGPMEQALLELQMPRLQRPLSRADSSVGSVTNEPGATLDP